MKLFLYVSLLVLIFSCKASDLNTFDIEDQAPVIIYQTTGDFHRNVPIVLNETKDRIIAYPDPSDLRHEGVLVLPLKLKKGYFLDRRGINVNTVFTSYLYDDYSKLESAPSLDDLYKSIIDKNPFESMVNCGKKSEYTNLEKDLNKRINRGLEGCDSIIIVL